MCTMRTRTVSTAAIMSILKPSTALRVTNVLGYIFLIVINALASKGLLGPTNEKLSKKNHTFITPAG
jgi:hypothetical protein